MATRFQRADFEAACDGCLRGYPYMNPKLTEYPCVHRGCTGRVRFLTRDVVADEWDSMGHDQRRSLFKPVPENVQTADI